MRAFSLREAVHLALADADRAARKKRGLGQFFKKADRIKRRKGWLPWWSREHGNSHAMKRWERP